MQPHPWLPEDDLAIAERRLDLLLLELSVPTSPSPPRVAHLSLYAQLLHAPHLLLAFLQRRIPLLELGQYQMAKHRCAQAYSQVAIAVRRQYRRVCQLGQWLLSGET